MENKKSNKRFFFGKFPLYFSLSFVLISSLLFYQDQFQSTSNAAVSSQSESIADGKYGDISRQTLQFIASSYYDPARINTKQMLRAGLQALSRSVGEILVDFPENASRFTLNVGSEEKKFSIPNSKNAKDSLQEILPLLKDIYGFIAKNYKGETEIADIERTLMNAMVENLDPHSALLPPKLFKEFKTQTEGEFGGLGIVVGLKESDLTVISPLEGTPAWKAGIKPKDKILKINSESTINMNLNEAVEKLRGKVGTSVSLSLSRENVNESFEVTLVRAKIKIDSIQSKLITSPSGDVGYIKIKSFQEDTYKELVRNLKKLKANPENFKGLILDLRNNPGGLLDQAIRISDLFLESGVIVSTVGAEDKVLQVNEAMGLGTEDNYPIAVLVNGSSASASEIVAGALKNNNRAIVIGEQTFGKGSVQTLYTLKDNSALKLTIAQYLTPGNESIQSVGITPDIRLNPVTVSADSVHLLQDETFGEKDLEKHLESNFNQTRKAVYESDYFVPKVANSESNPSEDNSDYSRDLKLDADYFVQLSKKIILGVSYNQDSDGRSSERPQILKQCESLEKESEQSEMAKINSEFQKMDIDWSEGKSNETPQAQVTLALDKSDEKNSDKSYTLPAGEESKLKLSVKNIGKGDFYRLIAKTETENPYLKNKEFAFGKIKSGETKSWTIKVKIPEYALSRQDDVKFTFHEFNKNIPQDFVSSITQSGKQKPVFAYKYQFENNQNPAKGTKSTLLVDVKNLSSLLSKEVIANLKNLEGESIYISDGRYKIQGLAANESKTAKLAFSTTKTYSKDVINLELSLTDPQLQETMFDKLKFPLNSSEFTPSANQWIQAPMLNVNTPPLSLDSNKYTLSGTIKSNAPLKDVTIYVGENKVYLKALSESEKTDEINFSTSINLEKKSNLVSVIGRDQRNLSAIKSFYIQKTK